MHKGVIVKNLFYLIVCSLALSSAAYADSEATISASLMGLGVAGETAKYAADQMTGGAEINQTLNLTPSGVTLAVQEATSGSKCMGSVTFNGTTAVTVSTTCAATGMRVLLTPTSDPTGSTAAYCWVTNISNGVSFDVDCDQANDGTANWFIIKEAA